MSNSNLKYVIGVGVIMAVIGWFVSSSRQEIQSPLATDDELTIPVIVEPGDQDVSAPSEAGAFLQQPGNFSGQEDGANQLQESAVLRPEELERLEFE